MNRKCQCQLGAVKEKFVYVDNMFLNGELNKLRT